MLAFASVTLGAADLVQRLFIAPWVKLRPQDRVPVLGRWIKIMAWLVTRPVAVLGGCSIPRPRALVPFESGVLVVMNHQSLFDIPLIVQTVVGLGYPRIVTRERYSRRIPLISHMIRLYQFPRVDPTAGIKEIRHALEVMAATARASELPMAVFPEGTRTKNGEIGRFKRGALSHILAARPWTVHVYVVDGFWRSARYRDFIRNVSSVRGRIERAGVLEWTDPTAEPEPFMNRIHAMMVDRLRSMRQEAA